MAVKPSGKVMAFRKERHCSLNSHLHTSDWQNVINVFGMCGTTEKSSTDRHTVWVAFKPATGLDGWKKRKIHLVEANSVQGHVHTVILLLVWFGKNQRGSPKFNTRKGKQEMTETWYRTRESLKMTVCLTHRWDCCVTHTHPWVQHCPFIHLLFLNNSQRERGSKQCTEAR